MSKFIIFRDEKGVGVQLGNEKEYLTQEIMDCMYRDYGLAKKAEDRLHSLVKENCDLALYNVQLETKLSVICGIAGGDHE